MILSTRILKSIYQLAVYTIGICVLLAAVTATLFRVLLPDIGMYRTEIEAWVSKYMNYPVAIHTLEADWQGWTPYLYLKDIDLLNKAGTTPIINFESAQISIDLVSTLIRRRIVPERLIISDFDVTLTRLQNGSMHITGIEPGNSRRQGRSNNDLAEWLFGQKVIELQHARIEWVDEKLGQAPVMLADVNLVLRSDGNRLQVEGSSVLPSEYGDHLGFALDATGNLLRSDWSAELYIQGNNINPEMWYRDYWPADVNLTGGSATVSMWSSWKNAELISMKGGLEYTDFEFQTATGNRLEIQRLNTHFNSAINADNSWLFNINIDQLITQNGNWQPSRISLQVEPDSPLYTLNFNYLKLDDLYPVLSSLSLLPAETIELVGKYPFKGELGEGRIMYAPNAATAEKLRFDITSSALNLPATTSMPVISGLSVRVRGSLENGTVSFVNKGAVIEYSVAETKESSPLDITGDLSWSATSEGYLLFTDMLQISNQGLNARLSGVVSFADKCCYINLMAETTGTSVDAVVRSLPYTSSFKLRDWLQRSVNNGEVHAMKALVRGHTGNFPFDNHTGVFELIADISDASLKYSPKWPAIDMIDGEILFAGRAMTINIHEAEIFEASIKSATATIPDLLVREKTVNIDGQMAGITADLKKYIQQSPLGANKMLDKLVTILSSDGNVELDLQLAVPIRTPSKQTEVNGKLKLANTTLTSDIEYLQFTDITGEVLFTRNSLKAEGVSALYDNKEIMLSVDGPDTTGNSPVTVVLSGNSDKNFIIDQVNRYFPKIAFVNNVLTDKISGSSDWQASLTYTKDSENTGLKRVLKISSDLYGMNVDLPQPLTKNAYTKTQLEISKDLDDQQVPLKVRYGDILSSDILINASTDSHKVEINFGNKTNLYPDHDGLLLYGEIDQLALDEWFGMFSTNRQASDTDRIPVQTDLMVNNLYLFGQTFKGTSVRASNKDDNWQILLGGETVNGELTIPAGPDKEQPIIANLKNLHLQKSSNEGDSKPSHINPSKLPSITAHIDSFHYADLDLGEMVFVAGAADYGMYIDTLSFTKPSFTIEANGKWNGTDGINNSSDFTIHAYATEFDKMLETFGYDVAAVKKGETTLVINANWTGTPTDFSLDKLNGTLGLKIGKGQLLDIQPSAGRLFGLLSLQTLPRRLTLDFSDLFGDGMAFDKIEGNFVIKNGDAYTDDLILKGPSVDIAISGRTGLASHDYDQIAEVTPQISDSLAVASGFFGPIGIGLGSILYFAGNLFEPLQDSINKILKLKYSISGTWNDPIIEKQKNNPESSG